MFTHCLEIGWMYMKSHNYLMDTECLVYAGMEVVNKIFFGTSLQQ